MKTNAIVRIILFSITIIILLGLLAGGLLLGVYTYDVAVSKARKATEMARENNFPLRLTVEPE